MPTTSYISPSNSLNKKNTFNLRTSEIPNYIIYGQASKNNNSYNNLQKLRINNPLRVIVEQLNIISIRNKFDTLCSIFKQKIDMLLVPETKIDDFL